MLNVDEDNYKEAVESSYKVSVAPGISKLIFVYAFMIYECDFNMIGCLLL